MLLHRWLSCVHIATRSRGRVPVPARQTIQLRKDIGPANDTRRSELIASSISSAERSFSIAAALRAAETAPVHTSCCAYTRRISWNSLRLKGGWFHGLYEEPSASRIYARHWMQAPHSAARLSVAASEREAPSITKSVSVTICGEMPQENDIGVRGSG